MSAKFPNIVFALGRLERTAGGVIAHGTWSMHGVNRQVDLAVTLPPYPLPPGTKAHLKAAFPIDMRQWNIPVPSTALIIRVSPEIKVEVDLALEPSADSTASLPAVGPTLGDLALTDHRGVAHQLGNECKGRLLMVFDVDARVTAKRCDELLSKRLAPAAPLIRVIDGSAFKVAERETLIHRLQEAVKDDTTSFLMDWEGAVRARLKLPVAPLLFLGFTNDGLVTGEVEGRLEASVLTRILTLVGRPAEPPFTADEFPAPAKKGR